MTRLVHRIVQRLRHPGEPLSRNRHFASFAEPEGREALRIHRQMRSLERDLLTHGDPDRVRVVACARHDRVRVEVDLPSLRTKRTAFLSRDELDLLLETPEVGPLLAAARWDGPGHPRR